MGHWNNYEQLEESLSLDELLATLNATRKRRDNEHRFLAAIQGVDLDAEPGGGGQRTFEDIQREAELRAQGIDPGIAGSVDSLRGAIAEKEGFGIGVEGGLNYNVV